MINRITNIIGYRGHGVLNEHGTYIEGSYHNDLGSSLGSSISNLKAVIEEGLGDFQILSLRGTKGAIFIGNGKDRTYFIHTSQETNYGLIREILNRVIS
ncbi:MAG TPA: hypothetical protein EYP24_00405 [bacterium (Candidatus Stahlbacteria)]|nr:hypothetical protein [Candidatus Stahlbacteria bacterium]